MIEIDAVEMSSLFPDATFHRFLRIVGLERRKVIERFRFREDAQRSLIAELLTRAVIARRLGRFISGIVLVREDGRKPRLSQAEGFDFNISHSGRWVVCASGFAPVGADVERIGDLAWDDAKDALSAEEQDRVRPSPDAEWKAAYTFLWTIKESYLKALGEGLSIPPSELTVAPAADGEIRLFRNGTLVKDAFFRAYAPDSEHRLAVCAFSAPPPEAFTIRTMWDVLSVVDKDDLDETQHEKG